MNASYSAISICINTFDLCHRIALYLDVKDLIVFQIVNKLCFDSATKAFSELKESKDYKYLLHTFAGTLYYKYV